VPHKCDLNSEQIRNRLETTNTTEDLKLSVDTSGDSRGDELKIIWKEEVLA
jgi:hypothetical protein